MFRHPIFAAITVSTILLVYQVLATLEIARNLVVLIFLISPILLIWMTLTILKDDKIVKKELNEDEEWGYRDKDRNSLGIF